MKILAQKLSDGSVRVVDAPPPLLPPGHIRVRTAFSSISPGTEGTKIITGKKSLLGKARAKPKEARMVLDMIGQVGLKSTIRKVRSKLEGATPLGYSLAGVVSEIGVGVNRFSVGDLVACAGGGAVHADEVVVPVNLAAKVPEGVHADSAAMTTLAAVAMQGLRLARPTLGENAVVIGLGVIGLMACQLLKAAGCRVLGADVAEAAVERARQLPAVDDVSRLGEDPTEAQVAQLSDGHGADLVLICAGTASNEPVELAGRITRQRGRVVVVGAVGMDLPREDYYLKEISFAVSCSYGPGRYDPVYEEKGQDYPYGFVRWTERRNLTAALALMAEGRFAPLGLVTHSFPFTEASRAYEMIAGHSEPYCGILLEYPQDEYFGGERPAAGQVVIATATSKPGDRLGVAFLGAGSFAQTSLLPNLKGKRQVRLTGICTRSGLGATDVGQRHGFAAAEPSLDALLAREDTAAVFIATRHDQHGPGVLACLEAGKHVFVEKPLCLTREDLVRIAQRSRELADAERLPVLMVGFNRRFSAAARLVKGHFGAAAGPVTMMYRISAGRVPREHWIQDPEEGGGRILGEVCHFVDLMQYLTGASPISVDAVCIETANEALTDEDNCLINLRFADGSIGSIGYFAEGASGQPKERLEVLGAGRSAVLDNFQRVTLYAGRGRKRKRCSGKGYQAEIAAFLDGVAAGSLPIPLDSLLATTLTTLQIRQALATGARQAIDVADLYTA